MTVRRNAWAVQYRWYRESSSWYFIPVCWSTDSSVTQPPPFCSGPNIAIWKSRRAACEWIAKSGLRKSLRFVRAVRVRITIEEVV